MGIWTRPMTYLVTKKNQQPIKFPEGTLFSVPLEDGRYAIGLIARRAPKKGKFNGIFGYFWGPFSSIADCRKNAASLSVNVSVMHQICGGTFLKNSRWQVLGYIADFDRRKWPFPDFYQHPPDTNQYFRVRFDEDDIVTQILHEPMKDDGGLQEDVIAGAEIMEFHLSEAMGALKKNTKN
jgi:Immunity protein 26